MIGSTFRRINVGQIKSFWICDPPETEQTAIATYLDRETAKIDQLVEKVETAIARLQEYRTALITAAVTGKIDVRKAAA
jgi:type I restriction enzyme S subunit